MKTLSPAALSKRIELAALPPPSRLPKIPSLPHRNQGQKKEKEGDGPGKSIEVDWRKPTDFENTDVEVPEKPEVPETSDDICERPNPPPTCGPSTGT